MKAPNKLLASQALPHPISKPLEVVAIELGVPESLLEQIENGGDMRNSKPALGVNPEAAVNLQLQYVAELEVLEEIRQKGRLHCFERLA